MKSRITMMATHFRHSASLLAFVTLLASCGGSDTSTPTSATEGAGTTSGTDTELVSDDSIITNDADNSVSTGESDNTNTTVSTEGDTSNSDESTIVVCGEVNNSFSYTIHNLSGYRDLGYSITSPVNGFGWDGSSFCDMDNSVGVTGIAAMIPQSDIIPYIDGFSVSIDPEWTTSSSTISIIDSTFDTNITRHLLESNVPGYQDGSRPGDWIALHDNEYLYIRFQTRNEHSESGNNQIFRDSVDPRNDDSIDIFIDADNSKGTAYDGIDDFHVTIAYQDSEFIYGPNSATGLEVEYQSDYFLSEISVFSRSYYYEIKIKLSSAGIIVGRPFGFDIQLNEDDNGGDRDARFGWFEPTGSTQADTNPSVLGTVLLTGCAEGSTCSTDQLLNPSL